MWAFDIGDIGHGAIQSDVTCTLRAQHNQHKRTGISIISSGGSCYVWSGGE